MEFIIYKYTNLINNKCYIGQTRTTVNRRRDTGGYKNCTKFYRALKKYGWENFKVDIIESGIDTLEKANEREKYWIKYYNSVGNGYNISNGGNDHTYFCKKIFQLNLQGEIIKEWESLNQIKQELGVDAWFCCNNRTRTSGGYCWCYEEDYINWKLKDIKNNYKKVIHMDNNKNIIKIYDSIKEASSLTGADEGSIIKCCKKKLHKTSKGYFCYYEDYDNFHITSPNYFKKSIINFKSNKIIIRQYDSIKEASDETHIPIGQIKNALYKHVCTKDGSYWCYSEEFNTWDFPDDYIYNKVTKTIYKNYYKASKITHINRSIIAADCNTNQNIWCFYKNVKDERGVSTIK